MSLFEYKAVSPTGETVRGTMEAASEAQQLIDRFVNDPDNGNGGDKPQPKPRVHTVRLRLRNKVIGNEAELDQVLSRLKEKCLKELNAGVKVRFEE